MSQATPDTPRTRPRWHPRFSLRTLLLASLLCGSGMLQWRNRAPWAVKYTIQEEREIIAADFSPDDKYLYTQTYLYRDENQPESEWKELIKIYDTETGHLHRTITCELYGHSAEISFSPAGNYIKRESRPPMDPFFVNGIPKTVYCELWAVETGEPLRFENLESDAFRIEEISAFDHFALMGNNSQLILAKLPSLEVVACLPQGYGIFSPDEKWLAFEFNPSDEVAQVISTVSGAVQHQFEIDLNCYELEFSPDNRLLGFITRNSADENFARLVEIPTGNVVSELPLESHPDNLSFSPDGRYLMTVESGGGGLQLVVWDWNSKTALFRGKTKRFIAPKLMEPDRLLDSQPFSARDIRTGAELWNNPDFGFFAPNGEYAFDSDKCALLSGRSGNAIQEFGNFSLWKNDTKNERFNLHFATKHTAFLTFQNCPPEAENSPAYAQVKFWHRRRPEFWYGFAWLPEFWLTVILAGALLWSVTRPLK